jgi:hypothetical protein
MHRLCLTCIISFSLFSSLAAGPSQGDEQAVVEYLKSHTPQVTVLSSEGEFVSCFNPEIAPWIQEPLTPSRLAELREKMAPHLAIQLSDRGFAPAATRLLDGQKDETNYDAIWVRDNVWVYYALARDPGRGADAKRLLLALWDYYGTPAQLARFSNIIEDPARGSDAMAVPHIRFDGLSPSLDDVFENGAAQVWNHRQIDAHGLFFTALAEAFLAGRLGLADLSPARLEVLSLYPLFLERLDFSRYEDAGAWEEIPRQNTSSIGLATRSLQVWDQLLYGASSPVQKKFQEAFASGSEDVAQAWKQDSLQRSIASGLTVVRRQLALGGESPDYPPDDIHFRRADAALIALIQPSPLEGLSEAEMRQALLIVETLKRPHGVLRYQNDSYQGGNFWIRPTASEAPDPTGDTSSKEAFRWRLSQLPAHTEAQWFFDSLLALARLHLAEITKDPNLRAQDLHAAAVHLKRALGQITGPGLIAADGKPVRPWQAPESINTVILEGKEHFLPSPITPLNWAKASLDMALDSYQRSLQRP